MEFVFAASKKFVILHGQNILLERIMDNILFEQLKKGDEGVLKEFFETFYPLYVAFAHNYVTNEQESEDLVQESFVMFWERRESFENIYYAKAFLYKTIRHKCLNFIRHRNVEQRHMENIHNNNADIEKRAYFIDAIIKEESSRMIYEQIEQLSKMGRQVIALSLDGLSNEEIAETLGISINTVRTHKARTYQQLRIRLDELKTILMLVM